MTLLDAYALVAFIADEPAAGEPPLTAAARAEGIGVVPLPDRSGRMPEPGSQDLGPADIDEPRALATEYSHEAR